MRVCVDIEVYLNVFTCISIGYDDNRVDVFEISERKNDIVALVDFLSKITYFIGFNCQSYDSTILMFIYKNIGKLKTLSTSDITGAIKSLSNAIIDDREVNHNLYSKYKYPPYTQIDLFIYWSKLTRINRKLSLKSFAINLNWHRVQELPIHHTNNVQLDQIDMLLDYNLNDVLVTKELAKRMSRDINLRADARDRYGFNCMSWDGVKLGLNVLLKRYCDRTGLDIEYVKTLRSPRESVNIGDILLPIISFKEADTTYRQYIEEKKIVTEFKSFYGLWKYLGSLVVSDTNQINFRVWGADTFYSFMSGGIHSNNSSYVIRCADDEYIEDIDVNGFYPTLGSMWNFVPEHLGSEFAEELNEIRLERLAMKANGLGKSNEAELLKLGTNGSFYGNTNNEYTPMYDIQTMLQITINGQLLLLMLAERLNEIGVRIESSNTDGHLIIYKKNLKPQVEAIIKEWEKISRTEMESVMFSMIVRRDVNNYIMFYTDESGTKEKGAFMTDPPIDQSRDFLIIPKAIKAYYKDGISIEDTIRNSRNIYDFTASSKSDKVYQIFWNGFRVQNLNRYFVTKGGAYLYKSKDGVNMHHVLKGTPVQIFNDYYGVSDFSEYNINYSFYESECKKLLNELEPKQMTLL